MRNRAFTTITIGGVDYSEYLRTPLTIQRTLDEQLDSAVLDLANMPAKDPFKPFTPVAIGGETYILAEDVVTEVIGRGLYKHSLTLIEQTKEAERIICSAKAFTRPLVHDYSDGETMADLMTYNSSGYIFEKKLSTSISTPRLVGKTEIPLHDFWFGFESGIVEGDVPVVSIYYGKTDPAVVREQNGSVQYSVNGVSVPFSFDNPNEPGTIIFNADNEGIYAIFVEYGSYVSHRGVLTKIFVYKQPISKPTPTVAEVINRLLEISETLLTSDSPRYTLSYTDEQTDRMNQPAPELHLANGRSLWENLREIGRYIHAIPRITGNVLTFDDLGGVEYADLSKGQRVAQTTALNIGDYTAGLDSVAANLINQDDVSDGSVTDPFDGGYITMRASSETARIEEGTGIIFTSQPIEKIIKVEVAGFSVGNKSFGASEITSSIYEKSEYDVLSSYTGGYPKSKSFALYYTQGGNKIEGLWYKAQETASEILEFLQNYSISNVIKAHLQITDRTLQLPYTDLAFKITYIPSVTARVRQYKPDYDGSFPSVIVHNQSANKLSAKALGENLRGQLAMMSNTTDTVTYVFREVADIPRAGTLYDDGRYISSITARIFNDFVVAQMTLAEGYNEMGAFVETPNAIRQFEIPASEDRYTVLEEFCLVSENPDNKDDTDAVATVNLKNAILGGLTAGAKGADASLALVDTYDYGDNKINEATLALPVMTLALGTSIYFGFRFEDNFAAGRKSVASGEKYRYQEYVPYADPYYAEAKSISFSLWSGATGGAETPNALPAAYGLVMGGSKSMVNVTTTNPILWHKDSADAGCITYQLHMVTDSDLILGDGLAYWCEAVRKQPSATAAYIYFYDHRINQLTGTTDTANYLEKFSVVADKTNGRLYHTGVPKKAFKSWAIIKNGRFVMGKNSTELTSVIYFNFKRRLGQ